MFPDQLDLKLLKELKKDSRRSVRQLAKSLEESPSTIYNRVKRLESRDVIKRWTVTIDYEQLDLHVTAFILIQLVNIENGLHARDVAKRIGEIEGVYEVHLTSGDYDIIAKVRTRTIQDVGKLVLDEVRAISGVGKTVTNTCFESIFATEKLESQVV